MDRRASFAVVHSGRAAQALQSVRLNTAQMRGGADVGETSAPGRRRFALRAGDLLALPVDGEVALLVGLFCLGLTFRHAPDWPLQRNAVVALAAHSSAAST